MLYQLSYGHRNARAGILAANRRAASAITLAA